MRNETTEPSDTGSHPDYEEWPVESEAGWQYLGLSGAHGRPALYNPDQKVIRHGTPDESAETMAIDEATGWDLDPEETLGEALERIGEEVGWDSLSAFAENHLEGDD